MLNITKKVEEKNAVLLLEGRLDTVTAPQLEETLLAIYPQLSELTFDLEKLEYISSAGLRVLLSAHKVMSCKGGLKVANVNEIVREVFEVTGFDSILPLE